MHGRFVVILAAIVAVGTVASGQGQRRLNPMVELLSQKKPVFGLYAPSNPRVRSGATATVPGGAARTPPYVPPVSTAAPPTPPKTAAQLAQDALANSTTDFIFDGTMEGGMDRALPAYTEFVKGMAASGSFPKSPAGLLTHPLVVKMHEIAPDPKEAVASISKQLNLGVSGIMFVKVESAEEAQGRDRRDALQVEGRHAPGRRRPGAGAVGPEREGIPREGGPVAAQSEWRAD